MTDNMIHEYNLKYIEIVNYRILRICNDVYCETAMSICTHLGLSLP